MHAPPPFEAGFPRAPADKCPVSPRPTDPMHRYCPSDLPRYPRRQPVSWMMIPTRAGRTEIVLEPVAFLRRLATLLPAPYQNLVRYHGVFANRSRYRKALPHPPARPKNARGDDKTPGDRQLPNVPVTPKPGEFRKRTHPSWAALLHRALHVDALSCPRCATPMVVLAFLTDPAVVTRILDHLHLPSTVPTIAPARDPDDLWALDDHGVREPTSGYGVVGRLALATVRIR